MNESLLSILKRYRINITRARLDILEIFIQSKEGLSHNYFVKESGRNLDRVTVFRTLKLFVAKKIVYMVPAPDRVNRYIFNPERTGIRLNFICGVCKKVFPLESNIHPEIRLPDGFRKQNMEITINGICVNCKATN
ncbi:MAG TPA: transcriptional repressor [Chitinophagaceae bacterium]|nr:transcriptional repressor [Chitinophagaceae bacterium]